jgi:hypothetical protein
MRAQSPRAIPLLVWWAECIDALDQLTPRNRARVCSILARDVRRVLAAMPDRKHVPPWLTNQLLEREVFELSPREWVELELGKGIRVIG